MAKIKKTGAQKQNPANLKEKVLRRAQNSLEVIRIWGGDKGRHVYLHITLSNLLSNRLFIKFLIHLHSISEAFGPDEAERFFAACPDNRKRKGRFVDIDIFNNFLSAAYTSFLESEHPTLEELNRLNSLLMPREVGSFLFEFVDTVVTLARSERIEREHHR